MLADVTTSEVGPLNLVNLNKNWQIPFSLRALFPLLLLKKAHSEALKYSGCWQVTTNTKRRRMMVKISSFTISSNY